MTPDVVQYDKTNMTKPEDLILGSNTIKELGIVVDSQMKELTVDEITLPMRDIISLAKSKMKKAWAVNNSIPCTPSSMEEAIKH